jgi:predicted transcriptional regulator
LEEAFIEFVDFQLDRVRKHEIVESTIRNYYKATKLFCEINDILTINWKKEGVFPKEDRHPTIGLQQYHIISYHIISYHIISYHIISYHIISYHIISYHIISYHIISYHIISYHIISLDRIQDLTKEWNNEHCEPPSLELSSAVKRSINSGKMIEWRRNKVLELSSHGHNQIEIAGILKISEPTVSRDISHLKNQAKSLIKEYGDHKLLEKYEKCLVGLNSILREAWTTASNASNEREKIQACYAMKLELLTDATVVDEAVRFIEEKSKDKGNIVSIREESDTRERITNKVF